MQLQYELINASLKAIYIKFLLDLKMGRPKVFLWLPRSSKYLKIDARIHIQKKCSYGDIYFQVVSNYIGQQPEHASWKYLHSNFPRKTLKLLIEKTTAILPHNSVLKHLLFIVNEEIVIKYCVILKNLIF